VALLVLPPRVAPTRLVWPKVAERIHHESFIRIASGTDANGGALSVRVSTVLGEIWEENVAQASYDRRALSKAGTPCRRSQRRNSFWPRRSRSLRRWRDAPNSVANFGRTPAPIPGRRVERDRDVEAMAAQVILSCGFEADELFAALAECGWPSPRHKVDRSKHCKEVADRWTVVAKRLASEGAMWLPQRAPGGQERRLRKQRRAVRLPLDRDRLDDLYATAASLLRSYDLPPEVVNQLWRSDIAKRGFVRTLLAFRVITPR